MSMEGMDQPEPAAATEDVEMKEPEPAAEAAAAEPADIYSDPSFLSDVMSELDGVDPNDPEVKAMMEGLTEDSKKDDEKKE